MKKLKVLSLFSGIGAFEKALENLGIDYELINYCDIDESASKCYSAIHNISEELNLWDVATVNPEEIKNFDLLTHGSPCQSFSINGKQTGGKKGSGTVSSLLWETVRIIKDKRPKYVVWENVKNSLSTKHKPVVDEYIQTLNSFGYSSFLPPKGYLTATGFGIPQKRDRVFIVSILNYSNKFEFPKPRKLKEKEDLKYFITFREKDNITQNFVKRYNEIHNTNITGDQFIDFVEKLPESRGCGNKNLGLYNFDELNRVTTSYGICPTFTCRGVQNYCTKFLYNRKIYKPSPRMCWRLMGFTDEDYSNCRTFSTDKELWDRAGNSIVVNIVEEIFKNLLKEYTSN